MTATWADPPPIGGPQDPRSVWMERLRPLVKHPGRWAIVKAGTASSCHQTANQLRLRQLHVPPGLWDFTVRTFQRGVHGDRHAGQIYARFRGCPDDWEDQWVREARGCAPSKDVAFDDEGRRVCPNCHVNVLHAPAGAYPTRCDSCWEQINPEWLRERERRRSRT